MDIYGTDGGDQLPGTAGDDRIFAFGGNDFIIGSGGVDFVDGGAGSDVVRFTVPATFGAGPETSGSRLFKVTGNRTDGGRIVETGGKFDTNFVNVESLSISNSGAYDLTVDASGSRGIVLNVFGSSQFATTQTILGGDGDDRINASRGFIKIDAGAGRDFITVGTSGVVVATQSEGLIELHQNGSSGQLLASIANAEQISLYTSNPSTGSFFDASGLRMSIDLQGSDESDVLIGGSGADVLQMRGRGSDHDFITGGTGSDQFYAISFDLLAATTRIGDFEGHDRIDFTDPATFDEIAPRFIGADTFSGTAGEYRTVIDGRSTMIEFDVDGDRVADSSISLGERGFILHETSAGSNVLEVDTSAGLQVGTLTADRLTGENQANFLYGFDGDDVLLGNGGNDLIEGGRGADTFRGGAGADIFLFDLGEDGTGRDRIADFGRSDIIVTTEALNDSNHDGRIDFGRNKILDFLAADGDNQGQVAITGENGARVTSLEYDGSVDIGDLRYFVYSATGSAAGVQTLQDSKFVDLLG